MNTFGHPHPVPYYEQAIATAQIGPLGNTPLPVEILPMPVSASSYLHYKAKTIERTVEWTPLLEGPGSTIDYTEATDWDGEKFISTSAINVIDPLAIMYSPQVPIPDQEKRDEIRGYALASAQLDPWPGKWMGIRIHAENFNGPYGVQQSEVAETMSYDLAPVSFEEAQAEFITANAQALLEWKIRLENWLAAESENVPQNLDLIADIERQIDAQIIIEEQVGEQQAEVISWVDSVRTDFEEIFGYTETELDKLCRNTLALEQDAFGRWIAAEEKLEAYAALQGSLWKLRIPFQKWVIFDMQKNVAGWFRSPNPAAPADIYLYNLAGAIQRPLSTDDIEFFATASIPALLPVNMIFKRTEMPRISSFDDPKNDGTSPCATIFEVYSDEYPYPNGICTYPVEGLGTDQIQPLCTEQIQSISRVSIGPRYVGTTPEMVVASQIKGDLPNPRKLLTIGQCELLSGVVPEGPTPDPEVEPAYSFTIYFQDVFDLETGQPKELDLEAVLPYEGSKEWAFKSPYAIYNPGPPESVDVGPLHELWGPIGEAWAEHNTQSFFLPGVPVGMFRILSMTETVLFESPLYASANTVTELNITLRVTEERE
jgi:hypothetical protein